MKFHCKKLRTFGTQLLYMKLRTFGTQHLYMKWNTRVSFGNLKTLNVENALECEHDDK